MNKQQLDLLEQVKSLEMSIDLIKKGIISDEYYIPESQLYLMLEEIPVFIKDIQKTRGICN